MEQDAIVPMEQGARSDRIAGLSRALALMRSPSKKKLNSRSDESGGGRRIVLHHDGGSDNKLVPGVTKLVPYNPGGAYHTFGNGTSLTKDQIRAVKTEQRNCQGLYDSAFFFPALSERTDGSGLTDQDRLDRTSIRRANRYLCDGIGRCRTGDCLAVLQDSDVFQIRQNFMHRKVGPSGKIIPQVDLLVADLSPAWNRSSDEWEPLNVALDEVTTVKLCASAYGLLCGVAASTLRRAMDQVKTSPVAAGQLVPMSSVGKSVQNANEVRSEDWCLLRQYVASLIDKHEANPAPGAHQPGRMTHITKTTWKSKWEGVQRQFRDAPRVPGSKSMLKKAWKLETRLKEKKACSHSKCNICSKIDKNMDDLVGVNTTDAVELRKMNARAQVEHEGMHLAPRTELDKAGFVAFINPRECWTLLADAATQRNFMLPKFKFRTPKKLAGLPFWSYKLMATYAYGYGFTPFLVHSSQPMGANLTWTVIWLTLTAMREHYGYWPQVLHITVDNTTGENKNETLLAMCAWLVASGRVKQVRVLFLMVGHTHVIIDHIFGVITVGLRRKELLLPEDLVQNIESSLAQNPQYMAKPVQILHCLWDFKSWCGTMGMDNIKRLFKGNIQDKEGSYSGMYDLLFSRRGTHLCSLQYREHCTFPWLPEGSNGAATISQLPTSVPELQRMKRWCDWSMESSKSVKDTIYVSLEYKRGKRSLAFIREEWQKIYQMIPDTIELLDPKLKLKFQYFSDITDDVLRIGMAGGGTARGTTGGGTGDGTEDEDAAYEAFKREHVYVQTRPLAIDPVGSSAQSEKEYEQRKAAMHAACRIDPNPTIIAASPIFMGEFVLALNESCSGVDLYCVASIVHMKSAVATDLEFVGVQYEHTPNAKVSGLFGTFKMKMTLKGEKREQTRRVISRPQVKVFNAIWSKKSRLLSIRTLRALALALPEQYPFPERKDIPEGHLADDPDEADRPRRGKKAPAPPKRGKASAGKKPVGPLWSGGGSGSSSSDSGGSSSSDSDSDSDSDSSLDEEGEQDEEVEQDEEGEQEQPAQSAATTSNAGPRQADPDPNVLLLAGPEPVLNTVIALNMKDDPEYEAFQHPVGFAYVGSTDPFQVYWYQCGEDQLQGKQRGKKARAFRHSNGTKRPLKNLTMGKFWNSPDWFKPTKKVYRPTEAQILANWHRSDAHKHWILPVTVPQPPSANVVMNETLKLDMEWVMNTLIPACEAAGCVQED